MASEEHTKQESDHESEDDLEIDFVEGECGGCDQKFNEPDEEHWVGACGCYRDLEPVQV